MTFKEAAAFVMPFDKYQGMTLGNIASEDEGLLYLAWLRAERESAKEDGPVDQAIAVYLDDPVIHRELSMLWEG